MEGGWLAHQLSGQRPGAQRGLLTPHPSPRVVHAVQCVDVKILTLWVTQQLGRPEVPTPWDPPRLTPAPSRTESPHPDSPFARSTRQCPLRCCCPPGPPGAHCGGEGEVRDCPVPTAPRGTTPGGWGLGGCQDLSRGYRIRRESSDCYVGRSQPRSDFVRGQRPVPQPQILSQLP